MKDTELVKCERCGRIRKLFQYTYFDTNRREVKVQGQPIDHGPSANPRFTAGHIEKKVYDESRGLCEECAVVVNCAQYDIKNKITPIRR